MKKKLKIADIIRTSGLTPFQSTWRNDANDAAAEMMRDRSHYYDASTLRYFGCKVQEYDLHIEGLVMHTIATQKRGFHAADGRGYVVQFHDCDGTTLTEGDTVYHDTRKQAERYRDEFLAGLDAELILRRMLSGKIAYAERGLKELKAGYRMLPRVKVSK